MSWRHLLAVWGADLGRGAAVKLVAARLADRADERTETVTLALSCVAHDTGLSLDQARRSIRALIALGVLEVANPPVQRKSTQYRMRLSVLIELARHDANPTMDDPPRGGMVPPLERPLGVAFLGPRGGISGPQGWHGATHNSLQRVNVEEREADAAKADALTRAAPAAPPGINTHVWETLVEARPDLDLRAIAEDVLRHRDAGCPDEDLADAAERLIDHPQFTKFMPRVRRKPRPATNGKRGLAESFDPAEYKKPF
jgi:hypothetical protein